MQIAASTPLQSVFGYGSDSSVAPVTPASAATAARSGGSWTPADQAFGAALIRETRRPQEPALYGPDARLRSPGNATPEAGKESGDTDMVKGLGEMSASDREFISRLQARDALVRSHEASHLAAAGAQAKGPAQYNYQVGPDGRSYAVGGSVNISIVSSTTDPEAAARQAETAARAASAVGEMSLKDTQVAMQAQGISARSRAAAAYAEQAGYAAESSGATQAAY